MRRADMVGIAIAGALALALVAGCAPKMRPAETGVGSTAKAAGPGESAAPVGGEQTPAGGEQAPAVGVTKLAGDQKPDFTATGVDGNEIRPADYKGKILVMDFWATWCASCCEKLKKYQPMADEYKPQGVEFLVFSLDDTPEVAKGWAKGNKITIPMAMMNAQVQDIFFPGEASVTIPRVRILDRNGAWRYSLESEAKVSDVEDAIKALLAEG